MEVVVLTDPTPLFACVLVNILAHFAKKPCHLALWIATPLVAMATESVKLMELVLAHPVGTVAFLITLAIYLWGVRQMAQLPDVGLTGPVLPTHLTEKKLSASVMEAGLARIVNTLLATS